MKFNQLLGAGMVATVLVGMALPLAAQADATPEVRLSIGEASKGDFNPYTVDVPRLFTKDALANDNVLLKLVNNSANHMVFKAPDLQVQGNSYLVPANTTREFAYASSAVGYETRQVEYSVEKIPDPVPPGPQFEDWKKRLAALVAAQRPDYSYFPQYQFNR